MNTARNHITSSLIMLGNVAAFFFVSTLIAAAQTSGSEASIAHYYQIENSAGVVAGDLISTNVQTGSYHAANENDNETSVFFGVVVEEPAVYFRSAETVDSVPIARSGIVPVNVSNAHGDIVAGDTVVFSSIPGVGAKATDTAVVESSQIVGIAQADFPGTSDVTNIEGVLVGQIMVDLDGRENAFMNSLKRLTSGSDHGFYLTILQYAVAAVIAAGSVYIAYANFSHTLQESVISIGRNPLAKDSIHRIVVYNSLLIVAVLAVGFLISFAVLRIQISIV